MGRMTTLSFQDSVQANSVKTLTSKLIGQPFAVRSVECEFALGQNGLVQLEVAIDNDDSTPTNTSADIGDNVFRPYSPNYYIRGNNTVRTLKLDIVTPQLPGWIKLRANNTDPATDHTINVLIQVELLSAEEYEAQRLF